MFSGELGLRPGLLLPIPLVVSWMGNNNDYTCKRSDLHGPRPGLLPIPLVDSWIGNNKDYTCKRSDLHVIIRITEITIIALRFIHLKFAGTSNMLGFAIH